MSPAPRRGGGSSRRRSRSRTRATPVVLDMGPSTEEAPREHGLQIDMLREEDDHAFMLMMEKDEFFNDKMASLRNLVGEIRQDDWKYTPAERLPAHVTRSLAWKQPQQQQQQQQQSTLLPGSELK